MKLMSVFHPQIEYKKSIILHLTYQIHKNVGKH